MAFPSPNPDPDPRSMSADLYPFAICQVFDVLLLWSGKGNLSLLVGASGRCLLLRSPEGLSGDKGLLRRPFSARPLRLRLPARVRHRGSRHRPGNLLIALKSVSFPLDELLDVFLFLVLGSWRARTRRPLVSALWSAVGTAECEDLVLSCSRLHKIEFFFLSWYHCPSMQDLCQPYGFSGRG